MTPQEQNDEALRRAKEEQDKLTEATLASADATDKAKAANLKMENATTMAVATLQKLLDVQLKYTIAMAKGVKGSAAFNDSVDATADVMTTAVNAIGTALAFLLPGGVLVKGLVAGFTFLTTNAIKSAAALQKAANEQGDALDKAYKSMSKSGATASDGMTGLFKDVNRMRLNVHQLDAMASTMANNAKEMTAMGGTVYKARKEYADLTANMKGFEKGMLMLGMSHEDQADAVMGYMKIQSQLTLGQQKDYGKQSAAARKYIEETEVLTRVTGLNRKEQESVRDRQMSQQRSGARLQELMDENKGGAVKLIQQQATVYAKMGPMAEQGYNDILSGHIQTEAAQKLMLATQGKVMQDQNDIIEGRVKSEREAMQATQETAGVMGDMRKSFGALYKAGQGENVLLPFKEMGEAAKIKAQGLGEAVDDARREVDKLTGTVGKADAQLDRRTKMEIDQNNRMLKTQEELDNKFMDTAIGTGTFMEKLAKAFEPLMKMIGKTVAVFEPLVSGLGDMLIGTISAVVKLLTGDFVGAFEDVGKAFMVFPNAIAETSERIATGITDLLKLIGGNLLKSLEFITGPLGPIFENVGKTMSGFGDSVKTGLAKFTDALVDVIKDLFSKLTALIPGFGAAKEIAGNVAGKVTGVASSAASAVSSLFGGGSAAPATPAGGGAPASAPAGGAPASAPAGGGKPTSAPAGGGKPTSAPAAPAGGGAPASAPAGGAASTTAKNVAAGNAELAKFTSLAANISKFESGAAGYNAYNKGTVGNKMIGSDKSIDFSKMTIAEYLKRGSLKSDDPDRIFAMGKYQIIPATMESLVKKLKLDPATTVLDANTQDLLFTEGLVNQTRTNVAAYLSGKSDNRDAAILDLAKEFASVGVPYPAGKAKERGESYYAGIGGNKAHNSPDQVGAALDADRQNKVSAAMGGVFDGPKSGYAATLHGTEAVIPLKDGAVPVSMSQEFNMTAVNLGELVNQMRSNMALQASMLAVMEDIRRSQNTTADNTGKMVTYASN